MRRDEIAATLLLHLRRPENARRPDLDGESPLLDGALDSLHLIGLLAFVQRMWGVRIVPGEARRPNLGSVATLSGFIASRLRAQSGSADGKRILIVQRDALFPPAHGGAKCVAAIAEALARKGHTVRVALRLRSQRDPGDLFTQNLSGLEARGVAATGGRMPEFSHRGVTIIGLPAESPLTQAVVQVLDAFAPDVTIFSEDALSGNGELLAAVRARHRGRVMLLVWTLFGLPFGPWSAAPSPRATEVLGGVDAILVPSGFAAEYVRRWSGCAARPTRFPVFGSGPFLDLADRLGPVLFINPSFMKGMPIFLQLTRAFPAVPFRVVPGWATTEADLAAFGALPNVTVIPRADPIATALAGAGAVLFPSLIEETFPLVPIEAMLQGVPVLASGVGGVRDAMLGADYVLPVRLLEKVRVPTPRGPVTRVLSPPQDIAPWVAALSALRASPENYYAVSRRARAAARAYAASLDWDPVCAAIAGAGTAVRP